MRLILSKSCKTCLSVTAIASKPSKVDRYLIRMMAAVFEEKPACHRRKLEMGSGPRQVRSRPYDGGPSGHVSC
jgi:hypothetical protein